MSTENPRPPTWWRPTITLATVSFGLLVLMGAIFTSIDVKWDREHGIPPESTIGFGAEFSWWLAGAVACFAYIVLGSYLLKLRAASENPVIRASCIVAVPLLGLGCPIAVQAAIDVTRAGYPGFICILPPLVLVWLPWLFAVSSIAIVTLRARVTRESAPSN